MSNDDERAAEVRAVMDRILQPSGSKRALVMRSGISDPTISQIAKTGVISSVYTGACLEQATDGAISVSKHVQSDARGRRVYDRFPGSEILRIALETGRTPTAVMNSLGINQQDLWTYSQPDAKPGAALSERIEAALDLLNRKDESQ